MAPGADGLRARGHYFRDRHGIPEPNRPAVRPSDSCRTGQELAYGRDDLWHSNDQVVGPGRAATPRMGSARRRGDRCPTCLGAHGELSADTVAAVRAFDLF